MLNVGIFGATGYTGLELVKLLKRHPQVNLAWLTSENSAGQVLSDVFACPWDDPLIRGEDAPLDRTDVVFLALPHGASVAAVQRAFQAGAKVIDLSADFRLRDVATYEAWYKTEHHAPELIGQAVYGLPELYRERIRGARLVANPGCYPQTVILGLYPLVKHGLLAEARAIADSKSGVSGAGRKATLTTHFVEAHDNFSPYNIGHVHRHVPEMEQELSAVAGEPFTITFSPHLLPVNQGILSTLYVRLKQNLTTEDLAALYREVYAGEPFIYTLKPGKLATLRHTVGTNRVALSTTAVDDRGNAIIVATLDNLIKGASGAAVQNMNLMCGFDETTALL
jgi:N-acetyl-gamma-glutamyl-phosphate reductase